MSLEENKAEPNTSNSIDALIEEKELPERQPISNLVLAKTLANENFELLKSLISSPLPDSEQAQNANVADADDKNLEKLLDYLIDRCDSDYLERADYYPRIESLMALGIPMGEGREAWLEKNMKAAVIGRKVALAQIFLKHGATSPKPSLLNEYLSNWHQFFLSNRHLLCPPDKVFVDLLPEISDLSEASITRKEWETVIKLSHYIPHGDGEKEGNKTLPALKAAYKAFLSFPSRSAFKDLKEKLLTWAIEKPDANRLFCLNDGDTWSTNPETSNNLTPVNEQKKLSFNGLLASDDINELNSLMVSLTPFVQQLLKDSKSFLLKPKDAPTWVTHAIKAAFKCQEYQIIRHLIECCENNPTNKPLETMILNACGDIYPNEQSKTLKNYKTITSIMVPGPLFQPTAQKIKTRQPPKITLLPEAKSEEDLDEDWELDIVAEKTESNKSVGFFDRTVAKFKTSPPSTPSASINGDSTSSSTPSPTPTGENVEW